MKISFTMLRSKGRGVILVEGAWWYEGAEVDLAGLRGASLPMGCRWYAMERT